jgi:hypothetical protein
MASSAFAAVCQTYKMTPRFMFVALCLATASGALCQNVRPASAEASAPRPIARTEGRKILATIPTVDTESESETDCSHLVHDVYAQAGFPYDYASSRELYIGNTNFTRVHAPQAGDRVVSLVSSAIRPKSRSLPAERSKLRCSRLFKPPATVRKIDHLPNCQSRHLRLRPLPPQRKPPVQQPSKLLARSFCK